MSRLMSLIALIAVIAVIGLLFYKVMVGFFVPVFLAAVLVVVFRPLHLMMLKKTGNRPKLAAAATTCLIMLCVLIPFGLIASAAALQGVGLIQDFNTGSLKVALVKLRNHLGLTREYENELVRIQTELDFLRLKAAMVDSNSPRVGAVTRTIDGAATVIHSDELSRIGARLAESIDEFQKHLASDGALTTHAHWGERLENLAAQARNFGNLPDDEFTFEDDAMLLSRSFRSIREEILGGPYLTALKDLANPSDEQISAARQQIVEYIQPRLLSLTSTTVGFAVRMIIGCAILIVCVFFFLYDGPGMVATLMALIPLDDRYEAELLMEFDRVSRAVVLATVFSAITQGAVAGIGYYVAGLPSLVLLIMLTTMFAMIPFVGPAIVWVPACLYLAFYDNRIVAASALALWGVLVVGTVDNFVKAGVLHGQSQLHPLLALLSVLGGVQALGPIGIVVGPMAVVLLQTSLSILQREMIHLEDHGFLGAGRGESPQARRFRLRRRRRRDAGAEAATAAAETGSSPQPASPVAPPVAPSPAPPAAGAPATGVPLGGSPSTDPSA